MPSPELPVGNLFAGLPSAPAGDEELSGLFTGKSFRVEKIVSFGHASPPGFWYDQPEDEWVLLLSGAARLRFEGEADAIDLGPGGYLNIPAGRRHRVDWTAPGVPSVWLAIHYQRADG
jgi:cupin 2 domain-containing protein